MINYSLLYTCKNIFFICLLFLAHPMTCFTLVKTSFSSVYCFWNILWHPQQSVFYLFKGCHRMSCLNLSFSCFLTWDKLMWVKFPERDNEILHQQPKMQENSSGYVTFSWLVCRRSWTTNTGSLTGKGLTGGKEQVTFASDKWLQRQTGIYTQVFSLHGKVWAGFAGRNNGKAMHTKQTVKCKRSNLFCLLELDPNT